MIPRAVFACPIVVAVLTAIGCADVLGFKTFREVSADGGAADGAADSSLGAPDASAPHAEAGPSELPCSPTCGAGQTCQNGSCVCDPAACTGCCSGAACSVSWPACGAGGGACAACDAHSDRCGAAGACACGSGPPCGVGLACVKGACTCAATSCTETCCGNACVDPSSDKANCGACGHSCLGADCTTGECTPTTLATGGLGWGVTVGPTTAYWVAPNGLYSCPLAGCGANPAGPFGVAGYVYDESDQIEYSDAGSGPAVYASAGNANGTYVFSIAPDGTNPTQVQAVAGGWTVQTDLQSPYLYWFTGTELERQAVGVGPIGVVVTNLSTAPVVAADANNVYVADETALLACSFITSQCGSSATVIASIGAIAVVATEPDAQNVYFGTNDTLYRCPSTGCPDPANVPPWVTVQGELRSVVADGTAVYWTDTVTGSVSKCALGTTCAAPTTLESNVGAPWGIAIDESYVYWTLADGNTTLQRAPK